MTALIYIKTGRKKTSRGITTGFLSVSACMPEYWRMGRDYLGTSCLRCNRNDFTALTFVKSTCCRTQQLALQCLIPSHHFNTNKKCPEKLGHFLFVADGEGFEPPEALRLQRFSRPSHSTALPPILNSFLSHSLSFDA